MITFKQFIAEATKRSKDEEQAYARGHALFKPYSSNGWTARPMAHAASQAKDRYPDATNAQWDKFLDIITSKLNTFTRTWAGDKELGFRSASMGFFVVMNVNFDTKQLRAITTLDTEMKPKPGDPRPMRVEHAEQLVEVIDVE